MYIDVFLIPFLSFYYQFQIAYYLYCIYKESPCMYTYNSMYLHLLFFCDTFFTMGFILFINIFLVITFLSNIICNNIEEERNITSEKMKIKKNK